MKTRVAGIKQKILIAGYNWAKYYQLFCYTRFSTGFSTKLVSIAYVNITTKSSAHSFKDNVFNIYSSLSICRNSSINKIWASYLASFNCYLTGNNNLSTQLSGQILSTKLFKANLQGNCCASVVLTTLAIICLTYQL